MKEERVQNIPSGQKLKEMAQEKFGEDLKDGRELNEKTFVSVLRGLEQEKIWKYDE